MERGNQTDGSSRSEKIKFTPFPSENSTNPFLNSNIEPFNYKQTVLSKTQKGHTMTVCSVAIHPKKSIVGTGSDDTMWKIWTVGQSELIMSGEGHKDWVSSLKFHPKGLHIVTASGDSTIKIWDFVNTTCTFTFKDHRQPVWSIDLN
jgi:WD40 repeat protein